MKYMGLYRHGSITEEEIRSNVYKEIGNHNVFDLLDTYERGELFDSPVRQVLYLYQHAPPTSGNTVHVVIEQGVLGTLTCDRS